MAEAEMIPAIVRGPRPHFAADGTLYAPGQIVPAVPKEEVSTEAFREKEIMVELNPPVFHEGELVTEARKKIKVPVKFRPVDDRPVAPSPLSTPEVVTGQPDRLNVDDFLKKGTDDIVRDIQSGTVDSFLGAIEQAEIARKGPARKAVTEAISARLAAK